MFFVLLLLWVLLNGHVSAEVLVLGFLVSGLLSLFCYRIMGYSLKSDRVFFRHLGRELGYFAYLVKEIIHAALVIIRIIYSPSMEMEPRLIYFDSGLRSQEAKAILADSITLTAGTITAAVHGEQFCVHTLDRSLAHGIENSAFEQKLRRLEE